MDLCLVRNKRRTTHETHAEPERATFLARHEYDSVFKLKILEFRASIGEKLVVATLRSRART